MKSSASGRTLRAALVMLTLAASSAAAQAAIRQERVKFAPVTSSATIKRTTKGDQDIDYLLGAAAGQTMKVTLDASNTSAYFNVLPPGSQGEAIFVGSTSGNSFSAPLASSGDYTVRVCGFGVIRGSPGNADVHLAAPGVEVTSPGAKAQVIRFAGSTVTAVGSGTRLKVTREGDQWSITIDDREHYIIPDAVIMGG